MEGAEGLQVHRAPRRKRAGQSSVPVIEVMPGMWCGLWIFSSMPLLVGVRSRLRRWLMSTRGSRCWTSWIPRSQLSGSLPSRAGVAAVGGAPKVLRMDSGPEFISHALQQFCDGKVGISYIPPGTPWNNGFVESFGQSSSG